MEKINNLKIKLNNYNLDGYLIPKNDEFFSEYVPENKDNPESNESKEKESVRVGGSVSISAMYVNL